MGSIPAGERGRFFIMKDPAVLFYTADFLTGTMLMDDAQIGRYIKLLCLQHQHGKLTEKQMQKVCGGYDEDVYAKFEQDENGDYYNRRMRDESIKRKSYSESRKNNLNKKRDMDTHMGNHMGNHMDSHMENIIININEDINTENNNKVKGEKIEIETLWVNDQDEYKFLKSKYPKLFKFRSPLTAAQHNKLIELYGIERVREKYEAIDNSLTAVKKYESAARVALSWLKRG